MGRARVFSLLALTAFALSTPLLAQQGTSQINGKVTDEQGAILPGVAVVVTNEENGTFRETTTSEEGTYFVSQIQPGRYKIVARLTGFRTLERGGLIVQVGTTLTINLALPVGGIEENVTVTGQSPLVDTTSARVGGNVGTAELSELPAMNRNYFAAVALLPGVQFSPSNQMGNDTIIAVRPDPQGNNVTVDGGYNVDDALGATPGAQVRTPVEAIQEFQVLTSMYDAEYGRASGAIVNAVTKSGTNQFKGVAFLSAAQQRPDVEGLPGQTGQPDETRPRRSAIGAASSAARSSRTRRTSSSASSGRSTIRPGRVSIPTRPVARLLDGRGALGLEYAGPFRPSDQRVTHLGDPVPEGDGAAVPIVGESQTTLNTLGRDRHRRDGGRHVDERVRQLAGQHRSAWPGPGSTGGTATHALAPGEQELEREGMQVNCAPQLEYPKLLHPGQHRGAGSLGFQLADRGQLLLVRPRQEGRPRREVRRPLQRTPSFSACRKSTRTARSGSITDKVFNAADGGPIPNG